MPNNPEDALKEAFGWVQLIISLFMSIVSAAVPSVVIPKFVPALQQMGAEIPPLTQFVLTYHPWLWLLPPLILLVRFAWPQVELRKKLAPLLGYLGLLLTTPITIIAMYLPTISFGSI